MNYTSIFCAAPRKPFYFHQTLDNYLTNFDHTPIVVAEPETPRPRYANRVSWFENGETLGLYHNFLRAISMIPDSDVLYMEDDIFFKEEAAATLRTMLLINDVSNYGFISLYCSKTNGYEGVKPDWYTPRVSERKAWCGNLCLYLPAASVQLIKDNEAEFHHYACDGKDEPRQVDKALGELMWRHKRPMLTHMPSLVLHLGEISTDPRNNVRYTVRARETLS